MAAYAKAGVAVPTNWGEFVASAPKLKAAGVIPLAMGQQPWQTQLAFDTLMVAVGGQDLYVKILSGKDADAAASADATKVFEAYANARALSDGSNVQDWNQATNMVITGKAGGQIMGRLGTGLNSRWPNRLLVKTIPACQALA